MRQNNDVRPLKPPIAITRNLKMGQTERAGGTTWSSLDYNSTQQTTKQRNDLLKKTGQLQSGKTFGNRGSIGKIDHLNSVNSNEINFKDSVVTFSLDPVCDS